MEKAKISPYQLFVLILLFELGSALLVPIAMDAKQDSWIAILVAMVGGFFLFFIYHRLFQYYPEIPLTEYIQKIIGKGLGRILAFLYILYFSYLSARVLRSFGEMITISAYPETPLFITNALLMMVIIYSVRKGIEVLARAAELLFILMYLLAISGFILIVISGLIHFNYIRPILEDGFSPVLKTVMTQTLFFPFGEVIVFTMILPYLNNPKKAKRTGIIALGLSGINLAIAMFVNLTVLGVDLTARSQFPLLTTIQTIQVADFLERLDVNFMLATMITGFFKISIFFYAAVMGTANLFKITESSRLVYLIGLIILFLSLTIASNYVTHNHEGVKVVPIMLHLPFQVVIPSLLLVIALFKNRK